MDISDHRAVRAGSPLPLGTHPEGDGVNFALFSRHATRVVAALAGLAGYLIGKGQQAPPAAQTASAATPDVGVPFDTPPDPTELLGSEKMAGLVTDLKRDFDFVLGREHRLEGQHHPRHLAGRGDGPQRARWLTWIRRKEKLDGVKPARTRAGRRGRWVLSYQFAIKGWHRLSSLCRRRLKPAAKKIAD